MVLINQGVGGSLRRIPKGIVDKIFFSISSPSSAVMSDAMNPGAIAFT
jgi:hypothetical protein